jgi:integrase
MSNAWLYQKVEQVQKFGPDGASWYVGWYEPDGRRKGKACGAGPQGKKKAERYRRRVEAELMTGTYQKQARKLWEEFRKEYAARILEGLSPRTRQEALAALDSFERIVKPVRVFAISTAHVDNFVAERRKEEGARKGQPLAPATVNKGLRHLKAALNVAREWGYLVNLPRFRMEKEPGRLPTYVPPEHFAKLYAGCEKARFPDDQAYPAADWWRALLVTGYMTGWRIGQMLALARADVDLQAGTALSRAKDNKGKRDQAIALHPLVVEHLEKLPGFGPLVFPWNRRRATLFNQFAAIQEAAEVKPLGKARYGFHDLRRAFATMNADKLTADALQVLMQHKDYQTTQKYINLARQLRPAAQALYVPPLPGRAAE